VTFVQLAFAYACLHQKYWSLCREEDENVKNVLAGRDQRAYDKLMAIVENTVKNAQGPSRLILF
jgi:hypothetical protein